MAAVAPSADPKRATLNPPGHTGPRRGFWTRRTLIMVFLFLFLIYFILPLFWLIVSSTKSNGDLFSTFGLWFGSGFHLFTNIHDVFAYSGGVYREWLWNTAYYATCSAVGA